jgi:hypothetical protein
LTCVSLWLGLGATSCAEAALDAGLVASPAEVAPELTPAACLSQSPVDLSIAVGSAPPSFYVNELRLGYSRGEAIFLSRPLCDLYGEPLCRFVEAHERAHHYTKTVGQKSVCAETLADCWAAAHADEEAVEAALFFFRSRRGAGGYHGPPSVRADTIARCGRRSGTPDVFATRAIASGAMVSDGSASRDAASDAPPSGQSAPDGSTDGDDADGHTNGASSTPPGISRRAKSFSRWDRARR